MRTMHRGGPAVRAGVIVLTVGLIVAGCGSDEPYVPAGIIRTPAPNVADVSLPDVTNGGELAFIADPGGILILYWGYTACPDICPTTMSDVRRALRELGDLADSVQVAMVTVDPDRDTAEVLTAYVHAFVDDGIALRTDDPDRLASAAEPFGVQYSVTIQDDGWVDVTHSAFLYAIDDTGTLRLTWPFGIEAELIEADLRELLEGELANAEA
jgi:protein SCO1/2